MNCLGIRGRNNELFHKYRLRVINKRLLSVSMNNVPFDEDFTCTLQPEETGALILQWTVVCALLCGRNRPTLGQRDTLVTPIRESQEKTTQCKGQTRSLSKICFRFRDRNLNTIVQQGCGHRVNDDNLSRSKEGFPHMHVELDGLE